MDREQVAKKREEIKESLRQSRAGSKFIKHEDVEAKTTIPTQFRQLCIPIGTKGIIRNVYKWVEGYDVEFKVHGIPVVVGCMEEQLKSRGK